MSVEAEPMNLSFYGLGELHVAEQRSEQSSERHPSGSDEPRWIFAIPVHGDLQGMFVLSTDHLPSADDSSSGLELINVLAARLLQKLEGEGIDLVMEPARILPKEGRPFAASASSEAIRRWSGQFSGKSPFSFELNLVVRRTTTATAETTAVAIDRTNITEESACSEHSSASS